MSKNLQTVVAHVWSHVVERADRPAFLVKNEGPAEQDVVVLGGGFPRATVIDVRPPVLGISWNDYGHMVAEASLFLRKLGVKKGDRVALLGWDSAEWMIVNRAIQSLGAITVPIYPNTTGDQVTYILQDSGATILLADDAKQFAKVKEDVAATLNKITFGDVLHAVPCFNGRTRKYGEKRAELAFRDEAKAEFKRLVSMYTGAGQGTSAFTTDYRPAPDAELDAVSTLIYTSGSTGNPKGVMLTHRNLISSSDSLARRGFDFGEDDVMLHYLPFAHIYGKANGLEICERFAVCSAFTSPEHVKEGLLLYRPTILLGVPRVWNKFRDGIQGEMAKAKGLKGKLIKWALTADQPGLKRTICDLLVFSKVRKGLGADRLRVLLSGSAAIPVDTIKFFNLIGLNLREGYGLTETTGGITANSLDSNKFGSLGKPIDNTEIRIVPRAIDTDKNTGVLWVRGGSIFAGYWNNPAKNKQVFDADGWFLTGDVVYQDEDGFLWYRGRDSRQKKLDTGKFYSEEKIQAALEGNPLLSAVVPVGEGKPFVGALIFVDAAEARKIAPGAPKGGELEFYAQSEAVKSAIKAAIEQANKSLEQWETVKQFEIVPVEPTVNNGLMTPTLKIRSEAAIARFQPQIDAIYARKR
jgi:long-chain acyl-CoA synthetase